MKKPPFVMKPSDRGVVLMCDGKFLLGAKASYVWETFLMRRVAGVPGVYEIRRGQDGPLHRLDWTIEEATEALLAWGHRPSYGKRRVAAEEKRRAWRAEKGLPVG